MIRPRKNDPKTRRGAAVVELAVLLPLLLTLSVGLIEMTRLIQVKHNLTNCSRNACRRAILPGSSNASVATDLNVVLSAAGIAPADVTTVFKVNGTVADVSTAAQGDTVAIQLTVPANKVNWLGVMLYSSSFINSEALTMMRQK